MLVGAIALVVANATEFSIALAISVYMCVVAIGLNACYAMMLCNIIRLPASVITISQYVSVFAVIV